MNRTILKRALCAASLIIAALLSTPAVHARVTVTLTNYHGWPDSYVLSNGKAEVVVVPAIGRIMQFGFTGEEGVFWENRSLDGRLANADLMVWASKEWVNFGGDKTWPSPESDWSLFTSRKGWRPPLAFDGLSSMATVRGRTLLLSTYNDPFYGTRAHRLIELHPRDPVMTVTTTYERIEGEPAVIGIWVITQLKEPVALFAPVPKKPVFPEGYALLSAEPPPNLKVQNGMVSLMRNPKSPHKIGLDGDSLLWVGEKHTLRIDSPRVAKGQYPDKGSSTEIYTSADPLPYIELETLGPLHQMKPKDKITRVNTYTLSRRTKPTPEAEARAIFR